MDDLTYRIEEAAKLVASSKHLVFFTGAGISTESGIPDYRGPDGVWTRKDKGLPPPKMEKKWNEIAPNRGHLALVELQNMGLLKFLISQNVDNLHLRSGIHTDKIAEFHGNGALMKCVDCLELYPKKEIWDENKWGKGYLSQPEVAGAPRCPKCKGRIVSSVVNFGDPIPEYEYAMSILNSEKADVFVVVGSSLRVRPASNMPSRAISNKAKLIIINQMETSFDKYATVRFYEGAGDVLSRIVQEVKKIQG